MVKLTLVFCSVRYLLNSLAYSVVRNKCPNDLAHKMNSSYVSCNFIGFVEFPVEFTQSGPDLPPSSHTHPESDHFLAWGVAKVEHTRLVFTVHTRVSSYITFSIIIIYQDMYTELAQKYLATTAVY